MVLITSSFDLFWVFFFFLYNLLLIPLHGSLSPCNLPSCALKLGTTVINSVLFFWICMSALMTYWWTTAFHLSGAFLPTRVSGVPMSKVSLRTFSFLIIPPSLFQSISSRISPHTTSLPQWLFEFSVRINVLKRKGLEEGWQACVTGERFTWGHKNQSERRGDMAHIKGSVCVDEKVSWPGQDEGRTAHTHHLHHLPFTPCPLVECFSA